MRRLLLQECFFMFLIMSPYSTGLAAPTVVTEDFADNANWLSGSFGSLTLVATGGPDNGSYVSHDAAFRDIGQGTIYRGHDDFDASGDAFVGNWIAEQYAELSMFVRHSAPVAVNYFVRLAAPSNFPAAGVVSFVPVMPDVWTELGFDVSSDSHQFTTFEGSDFDTVFSNVGNLQIAVSVPAGFESDSAQFTFDLDKVSLASVPEPTSLVLLVGGLLVTCLGRQCY